MPDYRHIHWRGGTVQIRDLIRFYVCFLVKFLCVDFFRHCFCKKKKNQKESEEISLCSVRIIFLSVAFLMLYLALSLCSVFPQSSNKNVLSFSGWRCANITARKSCEFDVHFGVCCCLFAGCYSIVFFLRSSLLSISFQVNRTILICCFIFFFCTSSFGAKANQCRLLTCYTHSIHWGLGLFCIIWNLIVEHCVIVCKL